MENGEEIILLEELLYSTDEDYVVKQIRKLDNPLILHFFCC
nr:hypothetical protein [Virgibacillus sp. NKC19-16]